jgi:type II secretory pathway pseudopilin PulG
MQEAIFRQFVCFFEVGLHKIKGYRNDNTYDSDCATTPTTLMEWRTIWLNGTGYAADGLPYTWPTDTKVTYAFNNLFLTALNPNHYSVLDHGVVQNYNEVESGLGSR